MTVKIITRRDFLKAGAITVGGLTVLPSLTSCGGAAAPVASPIIKTVAQYAAEFAVGVGANVAATRLDDWLKNLDSNSKNLVEAANSAMKEMGFVDIVTDIWKAGEVMFYAIQSKDGFNACSPFFVFEKVTKLDQVSMIEGPSSMGLFRAGLAWGVKGVSAIEGLIPIHPHQNLMAEFAQSFGFNDDSPQERKDCGGCHIYDTQAGTVKLNYKAISEKKQGTIKVLAERSGGGILFNETIDIEYKS